ncbi:MAG: hypothetical protein H0W89_06900 [Candidatus Levybacteria bacterium]|nr:hypothetical protein [Candidatus Levybacteria bacterium]
MVSFLITAKDKDKRIAYARDFCTKQQIDKFDITLIEKDTSAKTSTQSIGIEEVKNMQKKIFFKPIKSETKAVIIEDAQLLTTEAQNALLKVLEEPPAHTIIILGSDSKEVLLPTILSRCQLIALEEERPKLTEKARGDFAEFIERLPAMPIGDKLKKAELLAKDKDKAMIWVEKILIVLRDQTLNTVILVNEVHPESVNNLNQTDSGQARLAEAQAKRARMTNYVTMLQSFQKLHTTLKTTNSNPRFAIENTLLKLQTN